MSFEDETVKILNEISDPVVKNEVGEVQKIDQITTMQNSMTDYFVNLLGSNSSKNKLLEKVINRVNTLVDDMDFSDLMKLSSLLLADSAKNNESITSLFRASGGEQSMINLLQSNKQHEDAIDNIDSSADLKQIDSIIRNLNHLASQENKDN